MDTSKILLHHHHFQAVWMATSKCSGMYHPHLPFLNTPFVQDIYQYITLTLTDPCALQIARHSRPVSLSFATLPETRVFLLLFVTVMKLTQMAVPSHPYTTGGGASCTSTIRLYFQASSICCDILKRPYRQSVLHGLSNISYNHHQAYQRSQSPYLSSTDSWYKVYRIHL
jgi:hypothetical protein